MSTGLLINGAAMLAVALLSGYLAEQLRSVSRTVEEQQAHIYDLTTLNADIVRSMTGGLVTVSEEGLLLSMNEPAARILGASHPVEPGTTLSRVAPGLARYLDQVDQVRRGELRLQRDDLTVLVGLSVSPLKDHNDRTWGRIVNLQDITEPRRMEERMRRAEHLASLGRMAAGIAHEIRNPLGAISGSLEMLRTNEQMNPEDRRLTEIALKEIDRLDRLITDLLEYARPRQLQLGAMDLGQEIRVMAGTLASLMGGEDTPAIEVEQVGEGLWVQADRDQIHALLWNLVRNAQEAGERARIALRVGMQGEERVFLEVRDRAGGIPKSRIEHIFEPFYSTKPRGTGLGLATVYRIVQDHGGSIEVDGDRDGGTMFRVLLPRVTAPC